MRAVVLLTILNVLGFAACYPAGPARSGRCNCINMTPEKQKQIKDIEKQISKLLLKLEGQFQELDISDVTLNIKKYSEQDADKEINLIVTVNDCAKHTQGEKEVVYFNKKDPRAKKVNNDSNSNKADDDEIDMVEENGSSVKQDSDTTAPTVKNEKTENEKNSKGEVNTQTSKTEPRFEMVIVHLNNEERKKVEDMEKKMGNKPFLLIQHSSGEREIKFY